MSRLRSACVALTVSPIVLVAQSTVPIVNLPAASARSVETVGAVLGIRQLDGGKLLVNDGGRRQLRLFDAALATSTIVLDSTAGIANFYGPTPTPLVPYVGDSSLFADRKSRTVLVFDGRGRIARSMAPLAGQDVTWLAGAGSGVDDKGRLIFLGRTRGRPTATAMGVGFNDSLPVLRADLDLRRVDTVGSVSRPLAKATEGTRAPNGVTYTMFGLDPLKTIDEWSVLSDGSIAFVRGHDYHIDWVHPDGTRSSSAKMPFDWRRLTDDDKRKLADSARVAQNALLASDAFESELTMMTKGDYNGAPGPGSGDAANKGGRAAGAGGGEDPSASKLSDRGRGYLPRAAAVIPLEQIADYYPPIRLGATIPDLDGNLWILPTTTAQSQHGELVYDVVHPKRDLFLRVRVPVGRSIVGFGKGGVVYMASGDKATGFHVERTQLNAATK
jgi:hypothetical protein